MSRHGCWKTAAGRRKSIVSDEHRVLYAINPHGNVIRFPRMIGPGYESLRPPLEFYDCARRGTVAVRPPIVIGHNDDFDFDTFEKRFAINCLVTVCRDRIRFLSKSQSSNGPLRNYFLISERSAAAARGVRYARVGNGKNQQQSIRIPIRATLNSVSNYYNCNFAVQRNVFQTTKRPDPFRLTRLNRLRSYVFRIFNLVTNDILSFYDGLTLISLQNHFG